METAAGPPTTNRVLLILAHPSRNSLNGALLEAYREGLLQAGLSPKVIHLSDLKFDPHLMVEPGRDTGDQALEEDLRYFRREVEAAVHLAWFVPTWWGGPPAVLKGVIDRSFLPGWSYRYEGGALPTPLLGGRTTRLVVTMDSPSFWYRLVHGRSLHRSFVNATLNFVGFKKVKTTTLYSVRTMKPARIEAKLRELAKLGQRDGTEVRKESKRAPALAFVGQ